jgi:hypothetical protein
MAYTITSDRLDCAKAEGDSITAEELLAMGADIPALVAGGHISDKSNPVPAKAQAPASAPEGAN